MSILFLILTLIIVGLCVLLGVLRGRNRSILAIALTVLAVLLAFIFRGAFTNAVLKTKLSIPNVVENSTIENLLSEKISEGLSYTMNGAMLETKTQEIMATLAMPTVKALFNLLGFITLFSIIGLIFFIAYFPLKLVVKQEEKKQTAIGAAIGFVQSLIVALCLCGTIVCLTAQAGNALFSVDNAIKAMPKEMITENPLDALGDSKTKIENFGNSFIGKFYTSVFNAPFNCIASTKTKTQDGKTKTFKLLDSTQALNSLAKTATEVMDSVKKLSDINFENLNLNSISELKETFKKIDEINAQTPESAKEVINSVVAITIDSISISGAEEFEEEIKDALKEVDFTDVKFANELEVVEKIQKIVNNEEKATKEEAQALVKALSNSKLATRVLKKLKKSNLQLDPAAKKNIKALINDLDLQDEKEKATVEELKKILDI